MPKAADPLRADVKLYLKTVESAKAKYEKADLLLAKIGANWPESRKIVQIGRKKYEIVDQFAGQLEVWGHGAVRKWKIRPVKKSKAA